MALLLGFLGGVLAIGLKGVIDYHLERRRELRAVRSAARLIRKDVQKAAFYVKLVLQDGKWTERPDDWVTTESFDRFRDLLAAAVDDPLWTLLTVTEHGFVRVKSMFRTAYETHMGPPPPELDDEPRSELELLLSTFERANDKLFVPAVMYPAAGFRLGRSWIRVTVWLHRRAVRKDPSKAYPTVDDLI